ncbi:ABC transporter permease [Primorskyibacter aestuariivivens]|uniref:ABC transporter permease n=1 Tax=Primorskyibacter aestuariivivens TaxID=1888912 RepID=UPI002300F6BD|nr:ABC transporter permease [Primorskyibacter aestuariivivens]MDA7428481.1 ABC transporter permease [Primorskyibacter aestuariivivens]
MKKDTGKQTPSAPVLALSVAALIVLWQISAWLTADATIMPAPLEVWRTMRSEAASGELGHHMWATFRRVVLAFSLAMVLGVAIGVILGLSARANRWFGAWIVVFQNIPALVVIVLCYLWIGLNETAAIIAVAVNKTAMVAVTLREGVQAVDPRVNDMAKVFGMGRARWLIHVLMPQLWPYLAASMRNGLAIIWKIVLVVEFLGRSNGVGFQIHLYFQLFETGYVLAYAFSFVAVMLFLEYAVLQSVERRTTRWRRLSAGQAA